jgi:hypothetical protein
MRVLQGMVRTARTKRWLWLILLLSCASLFAQNKKFEGYVMNAAAFREIQTYCVDTHNLPDDDVNVINRFVAKESEPKGLLTRLPWRRRETCAAPGLDAIVRLEFPHDSAFAPIQQEEIQGVLLVFRPGSPSPIYETPAVKVPGRPGRGPDEPMDAKLIARSLEYGAASAAVRILIHDWKKM